MWHRTIIFALLLPALGCSSGNQYAISSAAPGDVFLAGDEEFVFEESANSEDISNGPEVLFTSTQLLNIGPGANYLFGGGFGGNVGIVPMTIGSGLLTGPQTSGLVNALIPFDRVLASLQAAGYGVAIGVEPGNALGAGGTLSTALITPGAPVGSAAGAASSALNGTVGSSVALISAPISTLPTAIPGTVSSATSPVTALLGSVNGTIAIGNLATSINNGLAAGPTSRLPLSTP